MQPPHTWGQAGLASRPAARHGVAISHRSEQGFGLQGGQMRTWGQAGLASRPAARARDTAGWLSISARQPRMSSLLMRSTGRWYSPSTGFSASNTLQVLHEMSHVSAPSAAAGRQLDLQSRDEHGCAANSCKMVMPSRAVTSTATVCSTCHTGCCGADAIQAAGFASRVDQMQ